MPFHLVNKSLHSCLRLIVPDIGSFIIRSRACVSAVHRCMDFTKSIDADYLLGEQSLLGQRFCAAEAEKM